MIRLLDRVYEAQVKLGLPPLIPSAVSDPTPVDAADLLGDSAQVGDVAVRAEIYRQRLARYQVRALADAGLLDRNACRADDVAAWWHNVWPEVWAVQEANNRLFGAIAPEHPQGDARGGRDKRDDATQTEDDHVSAFRAVLTPVPQTKPILRTDPVTCPTCGRPAPRRATYCVWCGIWLAARPR